MNAKVTHIINEIKALNAKEIEEFKIATHDLLQLDNTQFKLNAEQELDLKKSLEEADRGDVISHEEMLKETTSWLIK
jgi:predicted transcriptional regulator